MIVNYRYFNIFFPTNGSLKGQPISVHDRLLVIGYWLLVIGYWLLVIGVLKIL